MQLAIPSVTIKQVNLSVDTKDPHYRNEREITAACSPRSTSETRYLTKRLFVQFQYFRETRAFASPEANRTIGN